MTDRQIALTYGVATASGVALLLLIFDIPTGRNLSISVIAGVIVLVATLIQRARA